MAENTLHVRGHYSEKEINDKLESSIELLHELVVSIDDIGLVGHTLGKAERLDAALASARRALGLPEPPKPDLPDLAWLASTDDISDEDAAQSVLTGRSITEIRADIAEIRADIAKTTGAA